MHSAPWFREHDGWWYFYRREDGRRRQVKLVEGRANREAAYELWHELCRKPASSPVVSSETVVALLDVFLEWVRKNRALGTYQIYRQHLESFARHVGRELTVGELKPRHVTAWLDKDHWSNSTKAGCVRTVRGAFHWLVREGHIPANPVAAARGPSMQAREVILSEKDFAAVLKHSRPDFRRLLLLIRHTGCRPQEAVAIEARHFDREHRRIVFPPSEAKGKRHPRVIYLDDVALAIVEECCRMYPEGPLLRNAKRRPFHKDMVRGRFKRLESKVGARFCAYHLRHTFATTALQRLDPITVASLMGHSDASTLAKNYQHLAKLPGYMQEAARKATGEGV